MSKLYLDPAAEQEANDVGKKFMNSSDVVGDMSRAYGTDLSSVRIHTDDGAARRATERGVDAFSTGKDVFFARNVFNQNDPASRGLLAHELSHSLQQGVGGETGGMTQSAPMGAAQGGPLDFFRKLFGGGDAQQETPAEEAAGMEPAGEEAAQLPQMAGTNPQQELQSLAGRLQRSQKGGFGKDSGLYQNVTTQLNRLLDRLGGHLGNDIVNNMRMLEEQEQNYRSLIDACAAYTDRTTISDAGKNRKGIVREIQELAERDLLGLIDVRTDICAMPAEQQEGMTWTELLGRARTVRLTVSDYEGLKRAEGGQVSDVRMLNGENASLRDGGALEDLKFFKPEDEMDVEAAKDKTYRTQYAVALTYTLKQFPKLSKKDRGVLEAYVAARERGERNTEYIEERISPKGASALGYLQEWAKQNGTMVDELLKPSGILQEGGTVNMSRRNVATSRMAGLLGLGDLVARSQTAEIYDQKTGKTIRGNLMDKARGENGSAVEEHLKKNHTAGDTAGFSGGFQRDLTSLQVLDVLCGQMDRHFNNMFYQKDEQGNLIGVQAIDNDASFGTNVDVVHTEEQNRADRRVYDVEGDQVQMTLPFMDAALAARIEALTPEMVRYALADLLKEAEVEAAVRRLGLLQIAIRNARAEQENGGEKRFLENEEEWGEGTAAAMFSLSKDLNEADTKIDKENRPKQDALEKEILFNMLKHEGLLLPEEEDKPPEIAYKRLHNKDMKERTEDEKRLMSMASAAALAYFAKKRAEKTTANDTYFGRYFSKMGHK